MIAAIVLAVLLGLGLLAIGVRGKRIDDHPVCRGCKFDLIGAVGEKCPECGSELKGPRAIRIGNRRKRRGLVALGLVLLLAGALAGGLAGLGSKWNLSKHLPTAILIMQSRGGTATAGAAVKELESRLQAGTLKAADAAVIVDRGLTLQGNRRAAWAQEWGDFLESAWAKGLLSEEQKAQYAKNIVAFQFVMRNPAREGQKCGVSLEVSLARSGNKMQFNITPSLKTMHIGERVFSGENMSSTIGMMGSGGTGTVSEEIDLNVPPGTYDVESVWRVSVTTPASPNPLAEWETTERDRVEVLSRDAELVKRIRDETLRPAMETALSVSRVAVSGEGATSRCTGRIQIKDPPAPMAFDVIVRDQNGREWKVGVVTVSAGQKMTHSTSFGADTPGLAAGPVDVIFRSSVDAAMRTVFIKEMWDGEIVVKDIDPAAAR